MNESPSRLRVLVTRPKHQQSHFLMSCAEAGLDTITLPCLDILPVESDLSKAHVETAELIFFTSRNAVEFANQVLPLPWNGAAVYAIGRATERVLNKHGQQLIAPPVEPYSSEAFLEWYATQPPIKSALIINGMGGRDIIQSYFKANNVDVTFKSVYKRVSPVVSDAERHRVFVETPPHIISITSDEALRNLVNIAGPEYASVLHATQLVVNSERCADMAARLGFDYSAKVANPPGDVGQMAAIMSCLTNKLS